MKVTYNWISEYLDHPYTPDELSEVLTSVGLEVESMDKLGGINGNLQGVVVGEVMSCIAHPDAEKLRLTTVDINKGEPLSIVCGAPNVAVGQKVLVATIGTTLYPIHQPPIKIKKTKIRGIESHGMICAEDELGLGHNHEGILILNDSAIIGTPAIDIINIETDFVYEIGLTPNRMDAYSVLNIARDIYAYARAQGKVANIKLPPFTIIPKTDNRKITIELKDTHACPRYMGAVMTQMRPTQTPDWMRKRLESVGLRCIHPLVDIANYVMWVTGHPLHIFDYDKIEGQKIVIRKFDDSFEFVTLDNKKRILSNNDLMICDAVKPICIAGIYGGAGTGVTDTTTTIFIESAYFSSNAIRQSSRNLGLQTDASTRFDKGISVSNVSYALNYAIQMIHDITGAQLASDCLDMYPEIIFNKAIVFSKSKAQKVIGVSLSHDLMQNILLDLGSEVKTINDDIWEVTVPDSKCDVTRFIDLVEEIIRIYGINNVPYPEHTRCVVQPRSPNDSYALKYAIAQNLIGEGFSEIITNSLSRNTEVAAIYTDHTQQVKLLNSINKELDTMRPDLLINALEVLQYNYHNGIADMRLFEFGKIYSKIEDKYIEQQQLLMIATGDLYKETPHTHIINTSIYYLRGQVENVLAKFNLQIQKVDPLVDDILMQDGLQLIINNKCIGKIGVLKNNIYQKWDLPKNMSVAVLDWELMCKYIATSKIKYKAVIKFPEVRRDLSLLIDETITYEQIRTCIMSIKIGVLKHINLFDIYSGDKLPHGKKSYSISLLFQHETKTLTDTEIEMGIGKIVNALQEKLGANLRN